MNIAAITIYYNEKFRINDWVEYYRLYKDELYMHIIVDNGSDTENLKALEENFNESIIIHRDKNGGVTAAYNEGIRYALKDPLVDAIMFIGNDIKIDNGGVTKLYTFLMSEDKLGIVSPLVLKKDSDIIEDNGDYFTKALIMNEFDYNKHMDDPTVKIHKADGLPGAVNMAKRKLYLDIGLLDEKLFMYSDEVDIGLRAAKKGYELAANPAVKSWHQHINRGNRKNRHPFSDYLAVRNKIYLARKHISFKRSIYVFFYFFLLSFKSIVRGLISKDNTLIKMGIWRLHGALNGLIGNMKLNRWSLPN